MCESTKHMQKLYAPNCTKLMKEIETKLREI